MKQRPAANATSWTHQAAIHGTATDPQLQLANQCDHDTWYFLPWHRMYVFRFEQIVRQTIVGLGGPRDWALPYWNYTDPNQRALPAAFKVPGDASNPLFVDDRAPGINDEGELPERSVSTDLALSQRVFVTPEAGGSGFGGPQAGPVPLLSGVGPASGMLEATPHDTVHSMVGGWMGDLFTAAQDPIFWLHHANIDRLWDVWDTSGQKAPDNGWRRQKFSLFDVNGHILEQQCSEVVDVRNLGYLYDTTISPTAVSAAPPTVGAPMPRSQPAPQMMGASLSGLTLTGAINHTTVEVDPKAAARSIQAAAPGRVLLSIDNIEAQRNPPTVYAVYVDLPADPTPADLQTHYAGNLSFFGIEAARNPAADKPAHGKRVVLDITDMSATLEKLGRWDANRHTITFEPLTLSAPSGRSSAPPQPHSPVAIGRVSLFRA